MKNIKPLLSILILSSAVFVGCSKHSHESTPETSIVSKIGGFKAPSLAAAEDSLKIRAHYPGIHSGTLSTMDAEDTQYAYHDDPPDSLYYVVILPSSMAPDSLEGKEIAISGDNRGWQFGPVPDCRGNTIVTIEEIEAINNPQYLFLLTMWNNHQLVILPYCYPF